MRSILLFLSMGLVSLLQAQTIRPLNIEPDSSNYENIYVKKIAEDSLQSTYIIWVKKEVKAHYHARHSEILEVIGGTGIMTVDGHSFDIQAGDFFVIDTQSIHSVTTTSSTPLKVISIQCPRFDGDRIWVDQ